MSPNIDRYDSVRPSVIILGLFKNIRILIHLLFHSFLSEIQENQHNQATTAKVCKEIMIDYVIS